MTITENLDNTEKYKEKKLSAISLSRDNTVEFFCIFFVFVYAIYMYECVHVIVCVHNNIEIILTI